MSPIPSCHSGVPTASFRHPQSIARAPLLSSRRSPRLRGDGLHDGGHYCVGTGEDPPEAREDISLHFRNRPGRPPD